MVHLSRLFMFAVALALASSSAHAATLTFSTTLLGSHEVPANASPGTGSVTVTLDTTAATLQIIASFSGLTANATMAHIHCCAPLGTNVGVATTLPAFAGFPLGMTFGTYNSPIFSLSDSSLYNPAFVTLEGGLPQASYR